MREMWFDWFDWFDCCRFLVRFFKYVNVFDLFVYYNWDRTGNTLCMQEKLVKELRS